MSTQKIVSATRQEKLSTLVKAAWLYVVPFPRSRKLKHKDKQTDTYTHKILIFNIILAVTRSRTG